MKEHWCQHSLRGISDRTRRHGNHTAVSLCATFGKSDSVLLEREAWPSAGEAAFTVAAVVGPTFWNVSPSSSNC